MFTDLLSRLARRPRVSSGARSTFGAFGAIFSSGAYLANFSLKRRVMAFLGLKYIGDRMAGAVAYQKLTFSNSWSIDSWFIYDNEA